MKILNGADKDELLLLKITNNTNDIKENPHLRGVKMIDTDEKVLLPTHAILRASDFALIKTYIESLVRSLRQQTKVIGHLHLWRQDVQQMITCNCEEYMCWD